MSGNIYKMTKAELREGYRSMAFDMALMSQDKDALLQKLKILEPAVDEALTSFSNWAKMAAASPDAVKMRNILLRAKKELGDE